MSASGRRPPPGLPRLVLIRHARPARRGVFLGRLDPPASPAGLRDAAERLRAVQVHCVWTSPLERARQTAALLTDPASLRILDDLTDLGYGSWEGRAWGDIVAADPVFARGKLADWLGVAPPGGESWQSLQARITRALAEITAGPLPAAVVAHEAVNAAMLQRLTGADPLQFHQEYGEPIWIDLSTGLATRA